MQLYKGRKTVSSDQITRYKAHICQRNTGGKKKKKKNNTCSDVFTINLIFPNKLLSIISQLRCGSVVKCLPANASPCMQLRRI